MEFPITRVRLQNMREEYMRINNEKVISEIIKVLTDRIIQNAYNNKKNLQILIKEFYKRQTVLNSSSIEDHIPKIICKLQESFPDITITLDPMKTYIYVDWS